MNSKLNEPKISIIVAISKDRGIGKDNKLLWQIPEDMKRFKEITSGHAVIMGRKTFESIGRPLPDRKNIIITHNTRYKIQDTKNIVVTQSLEEAIAVGKKIEQEELFVIGGGQVYEQAIGLADKLYLTIVDAQKQADTFFPDYSDFKKVVFKKEGEWEGYKYIFEEREREG